MAGKRGNGEGNIRKRADGRWEARITLDDGSSKSLYGPTRAAVSAKMTALLREMHQHGSTSIQQRNERMTLGEFLTAWLPQHATRIDHSTAVRYRELLLLHVVPTLGTTPLAKLTAQQLERLYAKKLETLSPSTVKKVHLCLHRALEDALAKGLVLRNVCDIATAPRAPRARFEVWNEEEATRFLTAARGERLEALFVVALNVAMRQGELFALKWRDVDLETGALYLSGSLRRRTGAGLVLKAPKTPTSRRRIRLPAPAIEALRRHKAHQDAERAAMEDAWDDTHGFVFANTVGRGLEPSNVEQRIFAPLMERAKVPHIRFHDMRHTAATLLLRRGVHPKVVSEMLGHASIAITLDLYSHFLPDMQEHAVSAMDSIFGSLPGSPSGSDTDEQMGLGQDLGQEDE